MTVSLIEGFTVFGRLSGGDLLNSESNGLDTP